MSGSISLPSWNINLYTYLGFYGRCFLAAYQKNRENPL